MNVLMFTNYAPVQVQKMRGSVMVNEGWVYGLQRSLLQAEEITLHVMYPQSISREPILDEIGDRFIAYGYAHEARAFDDEAQIRAQIGRYPHLEKIDVAHIMGTEFSHSLAAYHALCDAGLGERTVVSVQGLVSFCAEHYDYGVPRKYCRGFSLQEIYNGFSSVKKRAAEFRRRGRFERQLLRECKNVIGRTNWDRRCTKSLNPDVRYYHNGENLRPSFYGEDRWSPRTCEAYSVFLSQATYPLKGLHHVLEVFPEIVKKYPEAKLYVAGKSPIHPRPWKRGSYARYLAALIKKGNLEEHIIFCGTLSEEEMRQRYLRSHVFLSASNIENSSNSIGEAMILGVPTVASNVGGTDSVVENGKSGLLYPLTEPYIMVREILDIFGDDAYALALSENAREHAGRLYDTEKNIRALIEIYQTVSGK